MRASTFPKSLISSSDAAPRLAFTLGAVAVATLATWAIRDSVEPSAYPLFFAAIVITSWYAGTLAGFFAIGLSLAAAKFFVLEPQYSFRVDNSDLFGSMALFAAAGLLVVGLDNARRRSIDRRLSSEERLRAAMQEDEERYRIALDAGGMGTWSWRIDPESLEWSPPVERMHGLAPGTFPATPVGLLQLLHPEDREKLQFHVGDALRAGAGRVDMEYRAVWPDGTIHWISALGHVERDAAGQPCAIIGVCSDITDRKRAEQSLKESEERFRIIADNAPVMVWMADTALQCTFFNKQWLEFTGRTLEQELGTGWIAGVHPEDIARAQVSLGPAMEARREFTVEYRLRRHDGEYRWIRGTGVPRIGPAGEYEGYIGSAIDIHERRTQEDRQRFLVEAGTILASSLDSETTTRRVVRLVVPQLADFCTIDVLQPGGELKRVGIAHVDADKEHLLSQLAAGYPDRAALKPMLESLGTGKTTLLDHVQSGLVYESAQDAAHLAILKALAPRQTIVAPLMAQGAAMGVLTMTVSDPARRFTEYDVLAAEGLAQRAGLAMENARLYTESQRVQDELRRREKSQKFLVQAGEKLGASLDFQETVDAAARLAVQGLADACTVYLADDGGSIQAAAFAHRDAAKARLLEQLFRLYPEQALPLSPITEVVRTGKTQLLPRVPDELLRQVAPDETFLGMVRSIGIHSAVLVPLRGHGRVMGALGLGITETNRQLTPADVVTAEGLAQRAALAIENSRLYTEGQKTQEDLRRANAAKDEFLGMVSHELRTPLTTMYSGTRFLRSHYEELEEKDLHAVLEDIEQESQRLQLIVENLLALARAELGGGIEAEPVALNRVVQAVVTRMGKTRPGREIRVHSNGTAPIAAAVPIYVELVLRNLLDNADKYSPPGTPIDVTVKVAETGETLVSVRDQGPGVSAADAGRIFDRFYRGGETAKTSGAGIGLSVCRRLAESLHGRIWANNLPDGGLEVTVALPGYETPRKAPA